MAKMTLAQWKQYAAQWKRAGPELDRMRREELAHWKYDWRIVDALLDIGAKAPRKEDDPNGLVEMQRVFMRAYRKRGIIPSSVHEEQARYGSDLPERARKMLVGNMGDDVPAGIFHLGNIAILERRLAAFFCSVRCPGNLILKAYDLAQKWRGENQPVISGFHSPVEREVLRILLRSSVPVCIVLARCLPKRVPTEFRRPLDEDRLLLLSPFDAKTKRATQETAAHRNRVVAALADRVFVAYAAPRSKTETFCRTIAKWNKPCFTFQSQYTENLVNMGFSAIDPEAGTAPSKPEE